MEFGVGLFCLQNTALVPSPHSVAYREFLETARLADELGYDCVWLSEHHFFYDGYCPRLLVAAGAALGATERVRAGTGMLLLPLHDPVRVAEESGRLMELSGGRLELGVGLGYREPEFEGLEVDRRTRVRRMEAGIDTMRATWEGLGVPAPRLWMGANSEPGMRRGASRGMGMFSSGALHDAAVADWAAEHRKFWEEAGRPGGTAPPRGALRNYWITDDPAEADAVRDWVRASYVQYGVFGWVVPDDAHPGLDFPAHFEESLQSSVESATIGSAETVIARIKELEAAGVDHIALRIILEGSPQEAVHRMMRRFAAEVFPEFERAADAPTLAGTAS